MAAPERVTNRMIRVGTIDAGRDPGTPAPAARGARGARCGRRPGGGSRLSQSGQPRPGFGKIASIFRCLRQRQSGPSLLTRPRGRGGNYVQRRQQGHSDRQPRQRAGRALHAERRRRGQCQYRHQRVLEGQEHRRDAGAHRVAPTWCSSARSPRSSSSTCTRAPRSTSKGSCARASGRTRTGQDRYTTEVVVDINGTMQMLDGRPAAALRYPSTTHRAASQPRRRSLRPRPSSAQIRRNALRRRHPVLIRIYRHERSGSAGRVRGAVPAGESGLQHRNRAPARAPQCARCPPRPI